MTGLEAEELSAAPVPQAAGAEYLVAAKTAKASGTAPESMVTARWGI